MAFVQVAQNVLRYMRFIVKKNCHQDLSKLTKSGHTDLNLAKVPN